MKRRREMSEDIYVLTMVTENTLRVLQRMADLFARHRVNIEQLSVSEMDQSGLSYFSVTIYSCENKANLLVKQLRRIFELKEVKINLHLQAHGKQHSLDSSSSPSKQLTRGDDNALSADSLDLDKRRPTCE
jgi:acetolactate synthase-1/3 small subunit